MQLKRCNAVSDDERLSVGLVNPHLSLDPVLPDGTESCSITHLCLFVYSSKVDFKISNYKHLSVSSPILYIFFFQKLFLVAAQIALPKKTFR